MRARSFRLHTAVLAVFVPSLLVATTVLGWMEYRSLRSIILDGFNAELRGTSTVVAAFVDADDHRSILADRDTLDPRYQALVRPMRRIRRETGITYLYTQVLTGPRGAIAYGLDATEGEDFSPPGSTDELPEAEIAGAEAVISRQIVHLTGIQPWEQWGHLKSAFAPIRNAEGQAVAMAGADVNLDVIGTRTRPALSLVAAVGLIALLLGGLGAIRAARNLETPVSVLRNGALRVAGGDWEAAPEPAGDRELRRLATTFAGEVERLAGSLRAASETAAREALDARLHREAELLEGRRRHFWPPASNADEGDGSDARPAGTSGATALVDGSAVSWKGREMGEDGVPDAVVREAAAAMLRRAAEQSFDREEAEELLRLVVPGATDIVRWHPQRGDGDV